MRHFRLYRIVFCVGLFVSQQVQASVFEEGVKAARTGDWEHAEQLFRKQVRKTPSDAEAFYNLGTSLAAQAEYGEAVWALEKSLKLNPRLDDAVRNLNYCYVKLGIPESWEPALSSFELRAYRLGIDTWTYISVGAAIMLGILLFFFLASSRLNVRKITFLFLLLGTVFLVFAVSNAWSGYNYRYHKTHAVLLVNESSVFSDNSGNMRIELALQEGNRFEIVPGGNGRIGLKMENNSVVWVNEADVKLL